MTAGTAADRASLVTGRPQEVAAMVTRRSGRAGSAQPAAPARRSERRQAESSTASSERRLSSEYLAYSSDDEFEQFMYEPV